MTTKTPPPLRATRQPRTVRLASDLPFGKFARGVGSVGGNKGMHSFCPTDTWTPDVNLYETESAYLVCVDLAGVDKDSIDLTVVHQRLTLRGVRDVPRYPAEEMPGADAEHDVSPPDRGRPDGQRMRVHLMEIDYGSFCREVELPADVDRDRINANYRNGMLWIGLPKR
ncbi:MAG: Hsp20/alpha crystallin family protein [Planctomycetota bacterium]